MTTIETLVNQSLDLIGYKRHVGNIYEGSAAARVALNCYAETRDELLHMLKPDWATRDITLTLLRQAPAQYEPGIDWGPLYPPMPWKFEYGFPDDCVVPLQIKEQIFFYPIWKPQANVFRVNFSGGIRTILSNVDKAVLTYTAEVHDPTLWHEDFTVQFIAVLAKKLAPSLAPHQMQAQQDGNARNT
jgi:hypothetical protein